MEENNEKLDLNTLEASDKRCSFVAVCSTHYLFCHLNSLVLFRVNILCFTCALSFDAFSMQKQNRRSRLGIGLANKKEEKKPAHEEDKKK